MNETHGTTVMVVEPQDREREEFCAALRRAGFAGVACRDGEQALQVLQHRAVKVLLTELALPGMRGELLIRQTHTTSPETVILAHSACSQVERVVEAFRCGASDFLPKTLTADEIVFRLKRVLQRTALDREDQAPHTPLPDEQEVDSGGSDANLRFALRSFEKRHLLRVLRECEFDKHAAAVALGIGLSSLYRKMDEFGIPTRTPSDGESILDRGRFPGLSASPLNPASSKSGNGHH